MMQQHLLAWYDDNQRHLPWRAAPGQLPNPYHVLLSEFMLQQTTVATVIKYFQDFTSRWPTILDLATATQAEVYHLWQGLGYYSRANNLWLTAIKIADDHQGIIPCDPNVLQHLPGVGPYTAAAIAAIAYDQQILPVDGNIIRVFSRFLGLDTPLPRLQNEVRQLITDYVLPRRNGDLAQALMDLGATICTPKKPLCQNCPLQKECVSYRQQNAEARPFKAQKPQKPSRYGIIFWYQNDQGEVWVRQRPAKGLLANLMEFPGTDWPETPHDIETALEQAPKSDLPWQQLPAKVKHTFTHFHLELSVFIGRGSATAGDYPIAIDKLDTIALPTLMRKVIKVATSP